MNLGYNIQIETVTESRYVKVLENCNGFTVVNKGTATARLNNAFTLLPPPGVGLSGESLMIGGNWGETYTGEIFIDFDAGGTNRVFVIQKIYNCKPGQT